MFRFLLGVAVASLVLTAGCNDGRNHGSNIPIDGVGGAGGGGFHCAVICDGDDVCGVEGVEECFPDCDVCETCEVCEVNIECDPDRYDEGFTDGVDSVVCETTDPTCEDDVDETCEEDAHKNAHKHCRGKGHRK